MKRWHILLLLPLAAWLLTGLVRIGPDEHAVVRRFGRVVATPGPGLWIGWPWGIDRVDRFAVNAVRQLPVGYDADAAANAGLYLTGDQNLVNLTVILDYSIAESSLDDHLRERAAIEPVLAREAETLAAEWLAGRAVDDVLLAGRVELPQWLMRKLPERLAPHRLGFRLQRASVAYLAAPAEVRDAFEAVNQAQSTIRTRELQARREAETRLQEAKSLRQTLQQQAEATRIGKLTVARADAEAFTRRLEQYRVARASNPEALAAIWWEEMGRTMQGLKLRGRIDLLDHHLGKDGLDITQFLPPKGK